MYSEMSFVAQMKIASTMVWVAIVAQGIHILPYERSSYNYGNAHKRAITHASRAISEMQGFHGVYRSQSGLESPSGQIIQDFELNLVVNIAAASVEYIFIIVEPKSFAP
jgi:hypothetical protein